MKSNTEYTTADHVMHTAKQVYVNTSGKYIQHPLRLSEDFKWSPGERVYIASESIAHHNTAESEKGYILQSMDYDVECPESRGFITIEMFQANFNLI